MGSTSSKFYHFMCHVFSYLFFSPHWFPKFSAMHSANTGLYSQRILHQVLCSIKEDGMTKCVAAKSSVAWATLSRGEMMMRSYTKWRSSLKGDCEPNGPAPGPTWSCTWSCLYSIQRSFLSFFFYWKFELHFCLYDHFVVGSIRLKRKLSAICRRRGKYKKERKTFVRVRERERNKKWRRALYKSVLLTVKCVLGDFEMGRVRYIKEWKKKKERW